MNSTKELHNNNEKLHRLKDLKMLGSEITDYTNIPEHSDIGPLAAFELFRVLFYKEVAFKVTVTICAI